MQEEMEICRNIRKNVLKYLQKTLDTTNIFRAAESAGVWTIARCH